MNEQTPTSLPERAAGQPHPPTVPYAGPTTPRQKPVVFKSLALAGTVFAVGAGVVMSLVTASSSRCRGATRSARLQFEQRRQQMAREVAELDGRATPATEVTSRDDVRE